jgi:nucleoside-diphosphate-sugar epimerase
MQKILIIGGTGTISTPITQELAQNKEVDLYVLNRGNHNQGLPETVNILKGDINDFDTMVELLAPHKFITVINFVLYTPLQAENNIKLFTGKTDQFILISTVAAYNHETSCYCDEDMPMGNRFSTYGLNKKKVEEVFMLAYRENGFPVTIVRPSQTYSRERIPLSVKGPKGCWPVISRMMRGKEVIIHGDGQSVWSSTHADDFANGFIGLIGRKDTIGEAYQIMNTESHTWDMVYQELARLLNVEYKPVYIPSDQLMRSKKYDLMTSIQGDKRFSCIYDVSKIKAIVPDFECKISVQDGLKRYLEYMDAHPDRKVEDPEYDSWCDETIASYRQAMDSFVIE